MPKKNEPTALYRAMQDLRRSSAASPHDSRPKRQRSRADAKRAAIRSQDGGSFVSRATQESGR